MLRMFSSFPKANWPGSIAAVCLLAVCLVASACSSNGSSGAPDADGLSRLSDWGKVDWTEGAGGAQDAAGDLSCVPDCEGLLCGKDGCGGSCGACAPNLYCGSGSCLAPEPVFDAGASEGDGTVTLLWKHPNPGDTNGTSVVRSFTHYPRDPLDGDLVYDGIEEIFVDSGLPNNTPCYYTRTLSP